MIIKVLCSTVTFDASGLNPRVTPCYNPDMAAIVGIHGIAQQFKGGYQLGTVWFDAVRDGLAAAGYRAAADALAPGDLRVAYFGDLFRPPGAMAAQEPPFTAADVQPGPERDLLTELYRAAVAQDPSLGPPPGAMGPGRAAVQVMLERLLRSRDVCPGGAAGVHRQLEAGHRRFLPTAR